MQKILISKADFDIRAEYDTLKKTGVGAVVMFAGIVRDTAKDPQLNAMTLEHYPGMTEQEIENIILQAEARWPLQGVRVIHRVGRLLPEENIVFVGTASAHRAAAFESAAFIMDYLKTKAPFWKKEESKTGSAWVDARQADETALHKWRVDE